MRNKLHEFLFPELNKLARPVLPYFIPQGNGIPKIIHQVFFGGDISPTIIDSIQRIKKLNPEWEYRFYGKEDIVRFVREECDPAVYAAFKKISSIYGVAQVDLFKYILMYKIGGIYLDIKSSLKFPLDSVLRPDDAFILSEWDDKDTPQFANWGQHAEYQGLPHGEFQQWYIISTPGHPFLKAVVDNIIRNIDIYDPYVHGVAKIGVLRLSGPIAFTLAISPLLNSQRYRKVKSESEMGLVYSVFDVPSAHATLFKNHYMQLRRSVITLGWMRHIELVVKRVLRKFLV